MLQQLFKLPKCYSSFSHSSADYFIIFDWPYLSIFFNFFFSFILPDLFLSLPFFFPSLLCALPLFSITLVTFSVLHSSPFSSVDFVVVWWLTISAWAWVCSTISAWAWVCADLGSVDLGLPAWVCVDLGVDWSRPDSGRGSRREGNSDQEKIERES